MKNVLIIGGAGSIWQKEYIKHIHQEDKVYLYTFKKLDDYLVEGYKKLNVELIRLFNNNEKSSKFSCAMKMIINAFKLRNKVDLIEFHIPAASIQSWFTFIVMKIINVDTLIVFWGSDILRLPKNKIKYIKPAINSAKYICLGTESMKKKFVNLFGSKYNDRIKNVKFGSLVFDNIKECKQNLSREECKSEFNILPSKKTLAIGYNGKQAQQHDKIIEVLCNLDDVYKSRLHILIHYSGEFDKGYNDKLERLLKKSGITYTILEPMLNFNTVAKLRLATDIFIQGQISDALSSTMRELFYAEAIIINPTWISYVELDKECIEYIKYNFFYEINTVLIDLLENQIPINVKRNSDIVYSKYSWESLKKDWMDIING